MVVSMVVIRISFKFTSFKINWLSTKNGGGTRLHFYPQYYLVVKITFIILGKFCSISLTHLDKFCSQSDCSGCCI